MPKNAQVYSMLCLCIVIGIFNRDNVSQVTHIVSNMWKKYIYKIHQQTRIFNGEESVLKVGGSIKLVKIWSYIFMLQFCQARCDGQHQFVTEIRQFVCNSCENKCIINLFVVKW